MNHDKIHTNAIRVTDPFNPNMPVTYRVKVKGFWYLMRKAFDALFTGNAVIYIRPS